MIVKYLQVGVINTLLTLSIIYVGINVLSIKYNMAYFVGYFIGLINSFVLNKYYTFKSTNKCGGEFFHFVLVFFLSYLLSHLTLVGLIEKLHMNENLSVVISMVIYTVIGYILNKNIFKG